MRYESAEAAASEVGLLEQPWVADEGPLEARLRRWPPADDLRPRGVAFDRQTTVLWDEDATQVIRRATGKEAGVVAIACPVLVRERRFQGLGLEVKTFRRIDYLRDGVLFASRYEASRKGGEDA